MSISPSVAVEVPAGPRAPRAARAALQPLARVVSDEVLSDVRLIVSELVSNSVLHAGLAEGTPIAVHARIDGPNVRVEVSEPGTGFVNALRGRRQSPAGAGLGLSLLDKVAARWGIDRSRSETNVWFEVPID